MPKNRTPAKAKAAGHGVLPSMVAPHAAAPGQASQPLSKTNLPLAPATGLPCSEGRCMVASARGIVKGGVNVAPYLSTMNPSPTLAGTKPFPKSYSGVA